jgi:catalase
VESGEKARARSVTFADHYSQARLFFVSLAAHERAHLVSAFTFELGKVETPAIRARMVGHLARVHAELGASVAARLGLAGELVAAAATVLPKDLPASPSLSMAQRAGTFRGRTLGVLVTDGVDRRWLSELRRAVEAVGARLAVVASRVGGVTAGDGTHEQVDQVLCSAPSVFFDAVIVAPSAQGAEALAHDPAAVDWVRDAFRHLKVIGHVAAAAPILALAGVRPAADEGVIAVDRAPAMADLLTVAKRHRIWTREAST